MHSDPVRTSSGLELVVAEATPSDRDELFALYALVVEEGGAFPQEPPADESTFERAWVDGKTVVATARAGGKLAGSYYLTPNYGGRASHIANAGYMVARELRGNGVGTALVEHSLVEARERGFDAMMFNLVFESNPARRLYERLGFEAIGRIPEAVGGEAALIYWRRL